MVLFTMGNAITMVCLGDLVGTLVLWYTPNSTIRLLQIYYVLQKNALKFDCQYN